MSPTASGATWRIELQNASVTWPDRVRPLASVMVPETMTGQRRPRSSKTVSTAKMAALALRVSKIVSMKSRSDATVEQAVGRLGVRRHELVEGHVAGAGVVDVGRDGRRPRGRAERPGDVPRLVRRLRRGLVGHPAGEPGRLEVELVGQLLHAVVGEGHRVGVEGVGLDDVGAGVEVLAVDRGDDVGLGEREQVVVALEVARPVGEALAAVARLGRPVALDRRAHRAVDHQDPLAEQRGELLGGVRADVDGQGCSSGPGLGHQPRNVRPGGGRGYRMVTPGRSAKKSRRPSAAR